MRKSLYFVLFIVLFNICRGTNSFDLEYLLQQKLQNQPAAGRFAQQDADRAELLRAMEKEDAYGRAAEDARWKQDMQNYYAKASQSIGSAGFDGTMDKAGLSHAEFRDYFNHKWFQPINDLIKRISEDAVAHGGRRNLTLLRKLEEKLSDQKLSQEMNRFGNINAKIDEYKAKMAKMPEWQRSISQDPDLASYMQTDANGDMSMLPQYDLNAEDPNQAAQANSFWAGLANPHEAFTKDDLHKILDKAHPHGGTYGVSYSEALKDAAERIGKLSPKELYDVGQEILYDTDRETFQALHTHPFSAYSDADLKDTLNSSKTSQQVKNAIKDYFQIKNRADKVIQEGFRKEEKDYANMWSYQNDPTANERMREKFVEKMAGKAASLVVTTNRRTCRRLAHGVKR